MHPLSPEKILRNLDHGYFMTHEEQAEAAQLIRQLQAKREWVGLTDDEIKEVLGLNETPWSLTGIALQHVMDDVRAIEAKLKEKNGG